MQRIAINGLGRIGKLVLRELIDNGVGAKSFSSMIRSERRRFMRTCLNSTLCTDAGMQKSPMTTAALRSTPRVSP